MEAIYNFIYICVCVLKFWKLLHYLSDYDRLKKGPAAWSWVDMKIFFAVWK